MKCPSCGYVSFDRVAACVNCGAPMSAAAAPRLPEPPPAVKSTPSPGEVFEVDEVDLDLLVPSPPAASSPGSEGIPGSQREGGGLQQAGAAPPGGSPAALLLPSFPQEGLAGEAPSEASAIVDRAEEVPERFWAPEGAGLVRRAAALLVDQALLAALLGLFLAGASLALERQGTGASSLLSWSGLLAALPPLALLFALLSLAYHVIFDVASGRTPGRRLAGLEVRSRDGSLPSWGSAALRWCGGALGLACGGVGIAWALFEPRRRGWADLLSNTMIVDRAPEEAGRAR